MKLKLKGSGSALGTIVVDDNGLELETLDSFKWQLFSTNAGSNRGFLTLRVCDVFVDIDPLKIFQPGSPKPISQGQTTFNLKVVGDGNDGSTYVVHAESEDVLENVKYISWGWDDDTNKVLLQLEVSDVTLEITPKTTAASHAVSGSTPHGGPGYSGMSGPTPSSPSPSPSYNGGYGNPNYNYVPGYGPASTPPPDPAGMPPDLMSCGSTCDHEWVQYIGFTQIKHVCKKCNVER